MPLAWREPELFLEVNGVSIFHAYKDEFSDIPLAYWYSTSDTAPPGSHYEFDVRELPGYDHLQDQPNNSSDLHKWVIGSAISAGLIEANIVLKM